MARTGRPPIQIDKEQFEKLCILHCTRDDIAGFFDCSADTIERWCGKTYKDEDGKAMTFAAVFKMKSAKGKVSLRRIQWAHAEKNPAMAIFLGKQYLGQTDQGMGKTDETPDDGFIEALSSTAKEDWKNG